MPSITRQPFFLPVLPIFAEKMPYRWGFIKCRNVSCGNVVKLLLPTSAVK
jgi:hypothetical protein